jgi:hypothetical protein
MLNQTSATTNSAARPAALIGVKPTPKLARARRVVKALKAARLKITFAQEMGAPSGSFGIEVGDARAFVEVYHDPVLMKSLGLKPDCDLVQVGLAGSKQRQVPEADVVATVLKLMLKAA